MDILGLKGIGEKTAALFYKLGIYTSADLVKYFPSDYDHFGKFVNISDLKTGEVAAVKVAVTSAPTLRRFKSVSIVSFNVSDGTGELGVVYFNVPYIIKSIKRGEECVIRGKVTVKGSRFVFNNPKKYKTEEYEKLSGTDQPIYHTVKGLSSNTVGKAVRAALAAEYALGIDNKTSPLYDTLPEELIAKRSLMVYHEAVKNMHMPEDEAALIKARQRLAYQEFLEYILNMQRLGTVKRSNSYPCIEVAQTNRLIEALPYRLTEDQRLVWNEIINDLTGKYAMTRLIQGDVGSGKTIVAVLALLMIAGNGYQGAFMAPTEVLASQHMSVISGLIKQYKLPINPVLLTGSVKGAERKDILNRINSGEADVIIGTHALFQDKVEYKRLGLVITDEQHRFGVMQREALADKGIVPHVLIMSATPIPRSLAMILYGEVDISTIHTMPKGRLPIKNCVVDTGYRQTAYRFITDEVRKGNQVYIICPQVESGELPGIENVTDYAEGLRLELPENIRIATLHGQMKSSAKEKVMEDFARNNIDVLVSTTVVEVGVNVPNATVMYVENAERFGLAQLHQLRGRVGRGDKQSYCIFMMNNASNKVKERLSILERSNDGFFIASEDMRLRGPGDIFGIRQSGDLNFTIGDIYQDSELILWAREDASVFNA